MKTITIPEQKIDLYRFEELSDEVKEKLQDDYRNNHLYKYGYAWEEELYNSLKTACKIFKANYGEDNYSNLYLRYDPKDDFMNTETAREMNFRRTIAYINNHFNFKRYPYIYKYGNIIAKYDKLTKIKIRYDEKRKKEKEKLNANERYQYDLSTPYPKLLIERYCKEENGNETSYAYPMAIAINKMDDNLPTGYCDDYVIFETYQKFIEDAKNIKAKNKKDILNSCYTLEDFLERLIKNFQKARDSDREYQESLENLEENIYPDAWFLEDGTIWKEEKQLS